MRTEQITPEQINAYRVARDAYIAAHRRADAAFARYFARREAGEPTNGAAWQRLENEANYRSAEMYAAEGPIWDADMDPADIDRADGVER